ncbi:DUF1127 domain-containing protein [Labrenzia sp. 011]|uniref:DUF1127 domain-containing protein n=1 Tax=Labrenzia sp. 011 TaxID=2171494 RepID=UPI000D52478F|nr:DUF1127 domain-containing protein [Labrenzia sp. 011]PVB59946.1 hypothetical protein DCO57_19845 [Labrenzia sp. 011]
MSSIDTIGGRRISRVPVVRPLLVFLRKRTSSWMQAARTRRQLRDLSDAALEDLGLTAEAARREAARPFWDSHGGRWSGGR